MKRKWIAIVGSGALALGVAVAGASFAKSEGGGVRSGAIRIEKQSEAEFPSMAKISMDQAVQNALASVQGQVLKTELEDENGFLVYGVEVVSADKSIVDVKVDAGTGTVLAMDRDEADGDGHESGESDDRDAED
ncbi:PepSY domain-containing protein [Desulfatirhabdium butyrativorans]|uniref:PepSY domain-containing protein n=1 Tax=Desulfatirhabdium butyrativorans TaxID=340467 RepID=UPI0003F81568|nr:PepSY domain-containing protein [Desulfatirhabdium butyrativorans]